MEKSFGSCSLAQNEPSYREDDWLDEVKDRLYIFGIQSSSNNSLNLSLIQSILTKLNNNKISSIAKFEFIHIISPTK
uniref:Uncharacterized protein n=1 Tax=Salix viminalis TaxID=40686 RepID=A0A6N2LE27_SALVM